jgi:cellobiose phosphorylase
LYIHPKLPKALDNITIKRRFRNTTYDIHIKHSDTKGLFRDGQKLVSHIVKNDDTYIKLTVHV